MKKLLLILAATAACMAFAGKAQAQSQAEVIVPIYGYSFQNAPSSLYVGAEVIMEFEMMSNASDPYPGKTARDILDSGLRQLTGLVGISVEEFVADRVGLTDYGWVRLKVQAKYPPVPVVMNFVYQSHTIRIN